MSAARAEAWATRALLALARSGVEIPEDIAKAGLAGVATLGIKMFSGVRYEDAKPLLDEMMTCVMMLPTPSNPRIKRALTEDDIEEVATIVHLREEVFSLHVNFSLRAARSKLASAVSSVTRATLTTPTSEAA